MTKYPQSTVEFIDTIPVSIDAQDNVILEYPWIPQHGGIYFYEMYLWDEINPVSYPFTGNFLSQGEMFVKSNLYSIKNQINSGTPLDELVCRDGLILAHRVNNANFVCVYPESIPKLVQRGWVDMQDSASLAEIADANENDINMRPHSKQKCIQQHHRCKQPICI